MKYSYNKLILLVFIVLMISFVFLFLEEFIEDYTGDQADVFFLKTNDYMADYYNCAKYSSDLNPYFNSLNGYGEKPYLPLSYIIFYELSRFADYVNLSPTEAGMSTLSLATSSFFILLISVLFFIQLYDLKDGDKSIKIIIILLIAFSGIFIMSFERGNIVLLSVVCTTFFLMNYESKKKYVKELSFISLAIAAALKGYPAIFGVLLLYNKQYKQAFRLMLYGIAISILPFLFLNNELNNIPQWISNLQENMQIYEYRIYPRFGHRLFINSMEYVGIISRDFRDLFNNIFVLIIYILSFLSLIFSYFLNSKWRVIGLLSCLVIILPSNSGFYNGLYFFPAIILFLNENNRTKIDFIYLLLILLFINPYQLFLMDINISRYIVSLSMSIISILLFIESLGAFVHNRTQKMCYLSK